MSVHVPQDELQGSTQLADAVAEPVLAKLKELGRVPHGFMRSRDSCRASGTLGGTVSGWVRGNGAYRMVLESLRRKGAAYIYWGFCKHTRSL